MALCPPALGNSTILERASTTEAGSLDTKDIKFTEKLENLSLFLCQSNWISTMTSSSSNTRKDFSTTKLQASSWPRIIWPLITLKWATILSFCWDSTKRSSWMSSKAKSGKATRSSLKTIKFIRSLTVTGTSLVWATLLQRPKAIMFSIPLTSFLPRKNCQKTCVCTSSPRITLILRMQKTDWETTLSWKKRKMPFSSETTLTSTTKDYLTKLPMCLTERTKKSPTETTSKSLISSWREFRWELPKKMKKCWEDNSLIEIWNIVEDMEEDQKWWQWGARMLIIQWIWWIWQLIRACTVRLHQFLSTETWIPTTTSWKELATCIPTSSKLNLSLFQKDTTSLSSIYSVATAWSSESILFLTAKSKDWDWLMVFSEITTRKLAGRCLVRSTKCKEERPNKSAEAALGQQSVFLMWSNMPNCWVLLFLSGSFLGEVTVLKRNLRFTIRRSVMSLTSSSTGTILSFSMQLSGHSSATNLGKPLLTFTFLMTRKSSSSLAGLTSWIPSTTSKRQSLLENSESTAETKKLLILPVLLSYPWRASRNQMKRSRYSLKLFSMPKNSL